ncbi:helix-turn-helix domain-containing protein [Chitinimonas sp. PSY-7]|uniref:helix-turn-helix domain-containing protein n=1 Tax=Chitinimonas sp. PSY-7 TaxID=3459088 RepID=UPI0040401FE0
MSIKLMSDVWSMAIPLSPKMVLLKLADYANEDGECWPGQSKLANLCSMSPRSVINQVAWLADHGLLQIEQRQQGNTRQTNRYTLTLDQYVPSGGVRQKHPHANAVNDPVAGRGNALESADSAHATFARADFACATVAPPNVQILQGVGATVAHCSNKEPSLNRQVEPSVFADTLPGAATKPKSAASNTLNTATWNAYAAAYWQRYGVDPIRSAMVNSQVRHIVKQVGEEAPTLAAYYVSHQDAWFVRERHPIGLLLKSLQRVRTDCSRGQQMTGTAAKQAEATQANLESHNGALAILQRKGLI